VPRGRGLLPRSPFHGQEGTGAQVPSLRLRYSFRFSVTQTAKRRRVCVRLRDCTCTSECTRTGRDMYVVGSPSFHRSSSGSNDSNPPRRSASRLSFSTRAASRHVPSFRAPTAVRIRRPPATNQTSPRATRGSRRGGQRLGGARVPCRGTRKRVRGRRFGPGNGRAGSKEINSLMTASYTSGTAVQREVAGRGQIDRPSASASAHPSVWSGLVSPHHTGLT
jgi:hypothetical protein